MSSLHYAVLAAVAAAVAALVTPLVRRFAIKRGLVVKPSKRKIHTKPTPELGGTAIFAGIVTASLVQIVGEYYFGWRGFFVDANTSQISLIGIAAGAAIMYLTGLIDDLVNLSPGFKLAGQSIAALVVSLCGVNISFLSNPFNGSNIWLDPVARTVLTTFYLVAFANIINLVDGLDGLACGISAISAISLLLLASDVNQFSAAIIAALIIGACVGFLPYNFNPASIFMGDEGALLLGFLLGIISLMGVMKTTAAIALAVPLLIVGVPLFDTFSAIVRRLRGKRPIKERDTGHIHHRLLRRGLNQRQTVLVIYAWSILLAIGGYTIRRAPINIRVVTLIVLLAITASLSWLLGLFEVAHHGGQPARRSRRGRHTKEE